jgi:cell shape-determining protein MreD
MNWLNTIAILVVAYVAVFLQATCNELRLWVGAQIDVLPGLIVYAGLTSGVVTLSCLAVCGGLWFDSLSANPLGISVLPLTVVGLLIQRSRDLILRDQPFAQFVLGAAASAGVPLLTLLLLVNTHVQPLVGWFSLWQWVVMILVGGTITPFWFWFFEQIGKALNYRPMGESSFRTDREMKRGRQ